MDMCAILKVSVGGGARGGGLGTRESPAPPRDSHHADKGRGCDETSRARSLKRDTPFWSSGH